MPGPGRTLQPRLPVLVGLGAVHDGAPAEDLMERAARAAADDAGAPELLASLDRIAVPQGSWSLDDAARGLAVRLGSPAACAVRYEVGVSQQEMLNHALADVASGACECVLVVGGEDRAWARSVGDGAAGDSGVRAMAAAARGPAAGSPDEIVTRPPDFVAPVESAAGIVLPPVQQYALIENALGAADGLRTRPTRQRDRRAVGPLQRGGPAQPRRRLRRSAHGRRPGAHRPAEPPARVPLQPLARQPVDGRPGLGPPDLRRRPGRRRRGSAGPLAVPPRCAVLVGRGHLDRAPTSWGRGPRWGCLGRAAETQIRRPLRDLALAEVYSCFPAAVRVQQRELGLDPSGTPTVTGGMAFAGGPFNHFVLLATVAVGRLLRDRPDELGLVTAVSGMLTKPGLAVWSATPPSSGAGAVVVADLAADAVAATEVVPVADPPPPNAGPRWCPSP